MGLRAGTNSIRASMTDEGITRIKILAAEISQDITDGPFLSESNLVSYAAQYLLTISRKAAVEIARAGMAHHEKLLAEFDEKKKSTSSDPVNVSFKTSGRQFTQDVKKPLDGGLDRLKGNGPPRRKRNGTPKGK